MSMAGRCIAASTASGMFVGPGMLRNSRPLETVMPRFYADSAHTSTLSIHAGRSHATSALPQHHADDLPPRVALEFELRLDDLVEEPVLGVREDSERGLPGDLRFEMIALQHDLEHTEAAPVLADIGAELGGGQRHLTNLGWERRLAQFGRRMVAILVQHE